MVLNIRNFLEKSRYHITYITLDISYNDDKKVRIRKIHKGIKIEELIQSKYKIDDNETYIYDNRIDLDMFSTSKWDPHHIFRKRYLNLENEEFKTQQKDTFKDVRDTLNEKIITQQKTSIIYTVKDGIMCRIDDYSYSENILNKFLEDFVVITEKTILREI